MKKFGIAMLCFVALGASAWRTLDDPAMRQARAVTLAVIASFAVRTVLVLRKKEREEQGVDKSSPM